jgi:hypothetical protein
VSVCVCVCGGVVGGGGGVVWVGDCIAVNCQRCYGHTGALGTPA